MLMHINGNFREGGDAPMNTLIHTGSPFWRGEGRHPPLPRLPGFVQRAGGWPRPGFSFCLHGQGLSTCPCRPASAPSPDQPHLPLTHKGLHKKVKKRQFLRHRCLPSHRAGLLPAPASPTSSAAGDGLAGKRSRWSGRRGASVSTRVVTHCFAFLCHEPDGAL